MYFVGVDSGGTKTAFVLCDGDGVILARHRSGSGGFLSKGAEGIRKLVAEGVKSLCLQAGIKKEQITFAGLGFPGYGEREDSERLIGEACREAVGAGKTVCQCDCYVGWAGSLAMEPGINIVSGTGSICFGVDGEGNTARSGGWGAHCDEGSCSWVGKRLIQCYTKQADGRMPKTLLYDMFRERFRIGDDTHFIGTLNHVLARGSKLAGLQMLAADIARAGDPLALGIYKEAAEELWAAVGAVAERLSMTGGDFRVSYSGGLFRSGELILSPLRELAEREGGTILKPRYEPDLGALLMAMRAVDPAKSFDGFQFTERRTSWESWNEK